MNQIYRNFNKEKKKPKIDIEIRDMRKNAIRSNFLDANGPIKSQNENFQSSVHQLSKIIEDYDSIKIKDEGIDLI